MLMIILRSRVTSSTINNNANDNTKTDQTRSPESGRTDRE